MKNQTRPSCACAKVEVDLLKEFPKRIKISVKNKGEDVMKKWIRIKYDYVPKYYYTYKLQGHDKEQCYVKHLELYQENKAKEVEEKEKEEKETKDDTQKEQGEGKEDDKEVFVEQKNKYENQKSHQQVH